MAFNRKTKKTEEAAEPAPRGPELITYQEYYRRHGFLPPGYSCEVDGKTVHGGCSLWREWANSQGYPQEPAPYATQQHKDDFQNRMNEIYSPWRVRR